MSDREPWIVAYCEWRDAVGSLGKDADQVGFQAGYNSALSLVADAVRAVRKACADIATTQAAEHRAEYRRREEADEAGFAMQSMAKMNAAMDIADAINAGEGGGAG